MTRVLVWKEFREQWTSAAAVLTLAAMLFASLSLTSDPAGVRSELAITVLLCMTWVAGLVAGIQPLAAERESGMQVWLDSLPLTQRDLWRAKAVAAGSIAAGGIVAISGVTLATVTFAPNQGPGSLIVPVLLVGLNGFCCGLFGSAVARTALGAFGWALAAETFTATALFFVIILFQVGDARQSFVHSHLFCALAGLASVAPAYLSRRRFVRLDRLRGTPAVEAGTPTSDRRAIAWLTWRQGRVASWLILGTGLAAAVILAPVVPHLWPMLGLFLGVLAGTGTFGADQQGQARQFFGDRRMPAATVWLTKTAVRFAPLAIVLAAYYLVGYLRVVSTEQRLNDSSARSYQLERLWREYSLTLVFFGPLTGFAWGQFVGMVCRKEAVATVIAFLIAVGVGLLWLPSLVVGGVHVWQWLGPPVLLIAATRLAYWPWVTGREGGWATVVGAWAVFLVAALGTVAGVAYRVFDVPDRVPPFDVAAFEASFPKPEQNQAGRAIQQAITHFRERQSAAAIGRSDPATSEAGTANLILEVLNNRSWPADSARVEQVLDAATSGGWVEELRRAVRLPLGVVDLGGHSYFSTDYQAVAQGTWAAYYILASGLRHTSRGEIAPAWDDYALVLDYCRQLRNKANDEQFRNATLLELIVTRLVPDWAVKAAVDPQLLRRAIDKLGAHEAGLPAVSDTVKLGYLAQRYHSLNREFAYGVARQSLEESLVLTASRAPWETYRNQSIENFLFAGLLRTAETTYPDALRRISAAVSDSKEQSWLLYGWTPPPGDDASARAAGHRLAELLRDSPLGDSPVYAGPQTFATNADALTRLRAAQLQLALILYQTREGKPATDLAALVPAILASLPADPFGEGPFGYRLSQGERVNWNWLRIEDADWRIIRPGQGVLWSVGIDLEDNGGHDNNPATWRFRDWKKGADILFVVPAIDKKK